MRDLLLTALLTAALAAPLWAQDDLVDPYTKGDEPALEAAAYVSLGPFAIGTYHGTVDVDELPLSTPVHWLETAHFKIGSSLRPYRLPRDEVQQAKVRSELARLKKRLPAVDPRTEQLDSWLRAHLLAQRCEEVYADFQARLDVSDPDFPQPGQGARRGDGFMGIGPYLGQRQKYVVLVLDRARDVRAYSARFLGQECRWPQRYNFGMGRSLLFVTSPEFAGWLVDDTAMHVHVVYDVVHMLCDGYRNFGHDTPVWFKTGLAQWYGRRIDPRYPNFDRPPAGGPKSSMLWDWQPIVDRAVRDGKVTPMAAMAEWRDYGQFRFEDYVVAWSRVAFLMERLGDAGLARFLFRFKDPLTIGRIEPAWDLVLDRQRAALHEAWGFEDWDALDRAWRAAVLGGKAEARSKGRAR